MISDKDKQSALQLARKAIISHPLDLTPNEIPQFSHQFFEQTHGVFITLRKSGELRGCIGLTEGNIDLKNDIMEMAVSAANFDPRFSAVTEDELEDISIEISILTPKEEVHDRSEIVIGKHGLVMESGNYRGLLLPQVPVEEGWNVEKFLEFLCKKTGVDTSALASPDTKLYRFSAIVFSEEQYR